MKPARRIWQAALHCYFHCRRCLRCLAVVTCHDSEFGFYHFVCQVDTKATSEPQSRSLLWLCEWRLSLWAAPKIVVLLSNSGKRQKEVLYQKKGLYHVGTVSAKESIGRWWGYSCLCNSKIEVVVVVCTMVRWSWSSCNNNKFDYRSVRMEWQGRNI